MFRKCKVKCSTAEESKRARPTGRRSKAPWVDLFSAVLLTFCSEYFYFCDELKITRMTKFWYALGDMFENVWEIMPAIGNVPNYISIVVIAAFFLYWTNKLIQFKRNGEA